MWQGIIFKNKYAKEQYSKEQNYSIETKVKNLYTLVSILKKFRFIVTLQRCQLCKPVNDESKKIKIKKCQGKLLYQKKAKLIFITESQMLAGWKLQ